MFADGADPVDHPRLERAFPKLPLHLAADRLPALAYPCMNAAIGDDLYIAIGEQQIDQDTVVVLGVPDAKLREHLDRPRARRYPREQPRKVERMLDRKPDLTFVLRFGFADRLFDCIQRARWKRALDAPDGGEEMPKDSLHVHGRAPLPTSRGATTPEATAAAT